VSTSPTVREMIKLINLSPPDRRAQGVNTHRRQVAQAAFDERAVVLAQSASGKRGGRAGAAGVARIWRGLPDQFTGACGHIQRDSELRCDTLPNLKCMPARARCRSDDNTKVKLGLLLGSLQGVAGRSGARGRMLSSVVTIAFATPELSQPQGRYLARAPGRAAWWLSLAALILTDDTGRSAARMQGAFGHNTVSRDAALAAAMVSRVTHHRDSTTPKYAAVSPGEAGRSSFLLRLAVAVIVPSSRFMPDVRLRAPLCMRK
jgi:hypothetical protein